MGDVTTSARRLEDLRVAVVDDDPIMRDLLSRALAQIGIVVVGTATDGASALELLAASQIDVLVCDLNMPGMDGIELLRHLAVLPDAPALAMVSGDDHILRIAAELGRAHRLRVLGTIPKPATPTVLSQVLELLWTTGERKVAPPSPDGMDLNEHELMAMIPDALELHYQPQIMVATGQPVGVEVLARVRHPRLGLLGPGLFVPMCEQRGRSGVLLRGVLRRSLHQLALWRAEGLEVQLAVNVSCDDLDSSLMDALVQLADSASVPLHALTLELTESRLLPNTTGPVEVLTRLRMRGVRLSIDDYGTGFSSLQQLRRIPFHELKIDQSFVSSATTDSRARTMLISTVLLARELGLSAVAEGVETEEQLALVAELGCDLAQGYYIARPMPTSAVSDWLNAHRE